MGGVWCVRGARQEHRHAQPEEAPGGDGNQVSRDVRKIIVISKILF